MDLKVVRVIKNNPPYGALEVTCPFKTKKGSTFDPKCKKLEFYGIMGRSKWGDFISRASERPSTLRFLRGSVCQVPMPPLKSWARKLFEGQKNTYPLSQFFDFCKNDYYVHIIWPRTPSFWPGQSSLAPQILVCWRHMIALQNRDTKGSSFIAILQGSRIITKIDYVCVEGKQTVYGKIEQPHKVWLKAG